MKKYEITFSREMTYRVVIERDTLEEALEMVNLNSGAFRETQEVKIMGKPFIKAVAEVNSKQRLDEG